MDVVSDNKKVAMEQHFKRIEEIIEIDQKGQKKIIAIGKCGLDFY
jgi:Tat protein secretion system quality control protein TatD with DNase activity